MGEHLTTLRPRGRPRTLSIEVVQTLHRLVSEGLSDTAIHKRLGVEQRQVTFWRDREPRRSYSDAEVVERFRAFYARLKEKVPSSSALVEKELLKINNHKKLYRLRSRNLSLIIKEAGMKPPFSVSVNEPKNENTD